MNKIYRAPVMGDQSNCSLRRKRDLGRGTKNIWRNIGWKFFKFYENYKCLGLRISMNHKQDKHNVSYVKAHYNKIPVNQL